MKLDALQRRAELLDRLRAFFKSRGFLEVQSPSASRETIPEAHIRLMGLADGQHWLQASPEMHLKRLLCQGAGPIFEVARIWRDEERGKQHHPEFTLVEWYRPGDDMHQGMSLLDELLQATLGSKPAQQTSYREAFLRTLGVDPHTASAEELSAVAQQQGIAFAGEAPTERDEWLNLLLSAAIEPTLGQGSPELLYHYPASQSALAKTATDDRGMLVAERFELYWRGVELANGYHELTDPVELRTRLEEANRQRVGQDWPALPLPEKLLAEMTDPGIPACAGVALGFDRLLMLALGAEHISDVVPFSHDW